MSFYRVHLQHLPAQLENLITQKGIEFGSSGSAEALIFTQPDLTYDPIVTFKKVKNLDVFFLTNPPPEFFEFLKDEAPQVTYTVSEEADKDWLSEWKKGFEPFELAAPYWVVPSWAQSPVEPERAIRIDPGMAFGTGTHATTKMAAYFVTKYSQQNRGSLSSQSFLDVGTGTGILTILADRLGFSSCTAVDIDPEARRVCRENFALNSCTHSSVSDLDISEIHEHFTVVVANIIDGVLIKLRNELLSAVEPQGSIFLTGILLEREELFVEKFLTDIPFEIVRRIEKEEWVGFWLKRNLE